MEPLFLLFHGVFVAYQFDVFLWLSGMAPADRHVDCEPSLRLTIQWTRALEARRFTRGRLHYAKIGSK
jgi:hypothetical protein